METLTDKGYRFALTFLDPPFNQGKEYAHFNDNLPQEDYWRWMGDVCKAVHRLTLDGGAIYFMQREKNTEHVLRTLREAGWTLQNLIIWAKRTSAVPCEWRYGKQYQIIAFATKGHKPRLFHRLRIDAPLRPEHRLPREAGIYVTDVWDDIRELTSGYFAGEEAIRDKFGGRFHKQQSPVALLARVVLSSTAPGDWVLDPFAGTGTTAIVARQLGRHSVAIEIDQQNVACIRWRLAAQREADSVENLKPYYRFTPDLDHIWGGGSTCTQAPEAQFRLFEQGRAYGRV
ncbi:MAG: site-specific DNA-methyltransferase [Anaerolineae bacterium]|nr:site-specific DNA-methyltransferase [Anaerolineae bacterium]